MAHPNHRFRKSLLFLLLLVPLVTSSDNVYLTSSYNQLVTSSNLRWVWTESKSTALGDNSNVVKAGSTAICRGWYQGQLIGGGAIDPKGRCSVTFSDKRHLLEKYQVLIDSTSTTKLEWQKWNRFTKRPYGTVAFNDRTFVARLLPPDQQHQSSKKTSKIKYFIGELDLNRGLSGDISVAFDTGDNSQESGHVSYVTEGEILVEIEPVRYEVRDTEFAEARAKTTSEVVQLGSRTLTNPEVMSSDMIVTEMSNHVEYDDKDSEEKVDVTPEVQWKEVTSVLTYNATYSYYWGHVPGLIRTLPSTADTLHDYGRHEFKWGLPLAYMRHRILDVTHKLLPGTSMKVYATARKQTTEVPYTARLIAHFADGTTKEKRIETMYQESLFVDIDMTHDPAIFLRNGSIVPTPASMAWQKPTTSPTTTTTSTPASASNSFPAKLVSLKPLRTTTPLPTTENPLLRFYPPEEEEALKDEAAVSNVASEVDLENEANVGFTWDAEKNRKVGKHNTRSSPMSDSWVEGASGGGRLHAVTAAVAAAGFISLLLTSV